MAKTSPKPQLPAGWKVLLSKSYPGRIYYFNMHTGASSWECPELSSSDSQKEESPEKHSNSAKTTTSSILHANEGNCVVTEINACNGAPSESKLLPTSSARAPIRASKCQISSAAVKPERNRVLKNLNKVFVSGETDYKQPSKTLSSQNTTNVISKTLLDHRTAIVSPVVQQSKVTVSASQPGSRKDKLELDRLRTKSVYLNKTPPVQIISLKRSFDSDNEEASKSFKTDRAIEPKSTISSKKCKKNQKDSFQNYGLQTPQSKTNGTNAGIGRINFKKAIVAKEQIKGNSVGPSSQKKRKSFAKNFNHTALERKTSCQEGNDNAASLSADKKNNSSPNTSDIEMLDISTDLTTLDVFNEACRMDIDDPDCYYIVLDTNVLMRELKLIDELKDTPLEGCGPPHIYIPWIVFQELDSLKGRHGKPNEKRAAAEAVRYLFSMLNSKHPRFHGQSPKQAASCSKTYSECNDDRILECCLSLADTIPQNKVILLTNDRNLSNKAMICDIVVHTWDSLMKNLKPDVKSKASKKGKTKRLSVSTSRKLTVNGPSVAVTVAVDTLICEAKVLAKAVLESYYRKEMTEAYGDSWTVFAIQPPYVLTEIVESIIKYWDTIFRFSLSQNLKTDFEVLHDNFKCSKGFLCNVKEALSVLTSILKIFSKIQNVCTSTAVPVARIEELKNECAALCQEHKVIDSSVFSDVSQFVLPVFEHIWALINHLCGMIMDYSQIQHNFSYTRPSVIPSKNEFRLLIPNLYPGIHQLKRYMAKVFETSDNETFRLFYNCLVQFVPSLQIQADPPPLSDFSVEKLKTYCQNPESRTILRNGYKQLIDFNTKLNQAVEVILKEK